MGECVKIADERPLLKEHEEQRIAYWHSRSQAELKELMQAVFPLGTLPEEADPVQFTAREIEIFRQAQWNLKATRDRLNHAIINRIDWTGERR
jgi:hypothetical protein